jgi:tetratricopeptide (TPR) repeat protein
MTTSKKKPVKKAPARAQKKPAARKVAPAKPRYSEQYERAIKEFEKGVLLLQKKDYSEGHAVFQRIVETYPDENEILDRARQYVAICEGHLHTRPARPAGGADHYHIGVYHLNRAETDAALKQFELALEHKPSDDMVHYAVAVAHAIGGDKTRAIASLQEAIRLNDRNRVYAQNDPDFDRIRDEHEFIQLVEPEDSGAH